MERLIAQQGDVLIFETDKKAKGEELDHLILAHGESGHIHRLEGLGKLIMMDGIMHLNIFSEKALLKHEEHKDIELKNGSYRIGRVKERDHFLEETREVQD